MCSCNLWPRAPTILKWQMTIRNTGRHALQLLRLGPTLLLRRPPLSQDQREPREGREGGDLGLVQLIRQRLALAEANLWDELLHAYLAEMPQTTSGAGPEDVRDLGTADTADRLDTLAAAVRKVEGGCLRAATQLLRGNARVPANEDTLTKLQDLTAMPVDATEGEETQQQGEAAKACWHHVPLIRVRTVRRKLRTVQRGADRGRVGGEIPCW